MAKRVWEWLGFRPGEDAEPQDPAPAGEAAAPAHDPHQWARMRLIEEIGDFILTHRLVVDAASLGAAFDCVSGADGRLAGAVADRRRLGEPVTIEWLNEFRRIPNPADEKRAMADMMERIERNMELFGRTTREARTATNDYQSALNSHVNELGAIDGAGEVISEVVAIARTMMERTRDLEQQMARSEKETRALKRSLEQARRNAEIDHLTKLPNRRAFEARLEQELAEAKAGREPLCVAFCDIDHFKKINDTHGHDAGDRVLKVVAESLSEISDERCHVARHGGEEFVVLFRGKSLRQAFETLDETRQTLSERKLVNRSTDVPFGTVTFSAGIADIFAFPDPRAALKAADEALYAAKEAGRNRIVKAPAPASAGKAPKAA